MPIVSPTKQADQATYIDCADILVSTYRLYQNSKDEEHKQFLKQKIDEQVQFLEWLKSKIANHDYTKEDHQYFRSVELNRKLWLSPGGNN